MRLLSDDIIKAQRYDAMAKDFKALEPDQEYVFILEGRAYIIKTAEVDDLDQAFGRMFLD